MNIIQIIPTLGVGGAETMCETLSYELINNGHKVTVVSLYDFHSEITDRMENAGVKILYLNKKKGFDISMIFRLKKIFKEEKADVIHTHLYATKYAVPAAVLAKVKCRIHTVHSIAQKECGKFSRKINKLFFKHFNLIPVALSDSVKSTIVSEYKLKDEAIPVVLNGVDLSKCIKKTDYVVNGRFKIIHVGRFQSVKNHRGLVEAFEIFNRKYPDSELHLIGDGETKKQIEQLVFEKKLSNCVHFYGIQSNVHLYLNNMDVFTLPSLYEGVPMSIVEAMGTGLPIVASRVGGIPDMLDDNCSMLVHPDAELIANAFEAYYLNPNIREKHGKAVLNLVDKFSSKAMAVNYINIYSKHV